jgi:urea transporter
LLRGIAQVFLCDHPLSGVLVCVALALSTGGGPLLGHALLGSCCSSLAALLFGPSRADKFHRHLLSGLAGFDGALVGCGCYTFLSAAAPGAVDSRAATLLVSICAAIIHTAFMHMCGPNLPTFTIGFNLSSTAYLLGCGYAAAALAAAAAAAAQVPAANVVASTAYALDFSTFVSASIKGVGQFMFVDTVAGGVLVLCAIASAGRRAAFCAWLGSATALLMTVYVLQLGASGWMISVQSGHIANMESGLYGYNAAGTAAALGGAVFYKATVPSVLYAVFGAAFTATTESGLRVLLSGIGLPVMTFPFVLSTWALMMVKSRHTLAPEPPALERMNTKKYQLMHQQQQQPQARQQQ